MLRIIMFLLLSSIAVAQAPAIKPPQPNYARYGSYSRQTTVYENTQRKLNELELEKYRRFREEVDKRTRRTEIRVITTRSPYYCRETRSYTTVKR